MNLVSKICENINRDGTVLDLVWSIVKAMASVSKDLNCTSDHRTLVGSAHVTSGSNPPNLTQKLHVSDKNLDRFSGYVKAWTKMGPINSTQEIERQVTNILGVLTDAIKAVGKRSSEMKGRNAPWWNADCKLSHRQ